jgi:restriction system protein
MSKRFLCLIHKEVMRERLDDSGTKIVPYCTHCECQREIDQITIMKEYEYQIELQKYKNQLERPSLRKDLLGYFVGLLFVGLGITNTVISESIFLTLVGVFVILIGCLFFYITYTYKPEEPKKPNIPSIDDLSYSKKELFDSLQSKVDQYKSKLKIQYDNQTIKVHEMAEIDNMDGFEFEKYIAELLKNLEFGRAIVTKKSGDFGADIIAFNPNHEKVAVQCKRYGIKNLVGVDAVQQIHSAMGYFDCQKAMVITNSNFSKPAYQMAQKLEVELWNRKTLKEKIASFNKENWNDYLDRFYLAPIRNVPLEDGKIMYV